MMEETGKSPSCIRRMHDKDKNPKQSNYHKMDREPLTDKYCHFCGTHGHITVNCEFMAKLITAMEQIKKVDVKSKKELQENFKQEQKQRRERKLARHTNAIRKLLDMGASREEIEQVLTNMQHHDDDDADNASKPLDSEPDTDSE
jgi:uncharacterized protein YjiS (DUF1127 family)